MDKRGFYILFILIIYFFYQDLYSAYITQYLSFNEEQLLFEKEGRFTHVYLEGCELTHIVGEPQLPIFFLRIALPEGSQFIDVNSYPKEPLYRDSILVFPSQPPAVYSRMVKEVPFTDPNEDSYRQSACYPKTTIKVMGTGTFHSKTIIELAVFPVRYFPSQRQIVFYSDIEIVIEYKESITSSLKKKSEPFWETSLEDIQTITDNQQEIHEHVNTNLLVLPEEDYYPYVIITSGFIQSAFQRLADWRTQCGLRSKIMLISDITKTFPGSTKQSKIRHFIQYAYENWNTRYILLGGDTGIIPVQHGYVLECDPGGPDNYGNLIPCDLYYADLQGNWDQNQNNIFGEVEDCIDLYPDIYIGRLPVSGPSLTSYYIDKLLVYEKYPDWDYLCKVLFLADFLWEKPLSDAGVSKDYIDDAFVPDHFNIIKLYTRNGNLNGGTATEALNDGVHIVNHDGHAFTQVMMVGEDALLNSTMDGLINGLHCGIWYSIGCWPGNFEESCIGEHYVLNRHGGGLAFIGNSRYGWGSPGNPKYGYSNRFDQKFYHVVFQEGIHQIGRALALSKAHFIPFAREANVYRWCEYEINLLGDPAIPIWTEQPKTLHVEFPKTLPWSCKSVKVSVMAEGVPIEGAVVCIWKKDEFLSITTTDITGQATCALRALSPDDSALVTVSGKNIMVFEGSLKFISNEPFLVCRELVRTDSMHSDSNIVRSGQCVTFSVVCENVGGKGVKGCIAKMTSLSDWVRIGSSSVELGDIDAQTCQTSKSQFSLVIDSTAQPEKLISLDITFSDLQNRVWEDQITLIVGCPVLEFCGLTAYETDPSNHNYMIESGEKCCLKINVQNTGLIDISESLVLLNSLDHVIDLYNTELIMGPIEVQQIKSDSVMVTIQNVDSLPCFAPVEICVQVDDGIPFKDTTTVAIGSFGLFCDFEEGTAGWDIYCFRCEDAIWHLSQKRSNSGVTSWHVGNETELGYAHSASMKSSLQSPPVVLRKDSELVFWAWYDVALFSVWEYEGDGLSVEIHSNERAEILDFIGTGGALSHRLVGNGWLPYRYDLSHYPEGTTVEIVFQFKSDPEDNQYEGFYIDDVEVIPNIYSSSLTPSTYKEKPPSAVSMFTLYPNYPNPFNVGTTIRFELLNFIQDLKIDIYNILGQQIELLYHGSIKAGQYTFCWDGKTKNNTAAPAGLYICYLKAGPISEYIKMVLIK